MRDVLFKPRNEYEHQFIAKMFTFFYNCMYNTGPLGPTLFILFLPSLVPIPLTMM